VTQMRARRLGITTSAAQTSPGRGLATSRVGHRLLREARDEAAPADAALEPAQFTVSMMPSWFRSRVGTAKIRHFGLRQGGRQGGRCAREVTAVVGSGPSAPTRGRTSAEVSGVRSPWRPDAVRPGGHQTPPSWGAVAGREQMRSELANKATQLTCEFGVMGFCTSALEVLRPQASRPSSTGCRPRTQNWQI
jgi:hypothetical protein